MKYFRYVKSKSTERDSCKICEGKLKCFIMDINTCIKKSPFPDKRKTADITQTFKKSDHKSNYPPVSVLTILPTFYENVFINK